MVACGFGTWCCGLLFRMLNRPGRRRCRRKHWQSAGRVARLYDMLVRKSALVGLVIGAAVLMAGGVCRAADVEVEWFTRASEDRMLGFVHPGRIGKVLVEEGQVVKAGELLVQLDDEAEQVQVKQLEAEAQVDLYVRSAEAELAQKQEDVKKLKAAEVKQWDIVHAELEAKIAELSLQLARFKREQSERKHKEGRINLERMKILSPIDGKVEKLLKKTGESVDAHQDIIRVVKIDPVRIDAPVPVDMARKFKLQDKARVRFKDGAEVVGEIGFIGAVADPASHTLTVRVEAPNSAGRPAGERVTVHFSVPDTGESPMSTQTQGGR